MLLEHLSKHARSFSILVLLRPSTVDRGATLLLNDVICTVDDFLERRFRCVKTFLSRRIFATVVSDDVVLLKPTNLFLLTNPLRHILELKVF